METTDNIMIIETSSNHSFDDEIVINNDIDPHCKVYHNDTCIGEIKNVTALNDFLVQVMERHKSNEEISEYSVEFNGKMLPVIFPHGSTRPRIQARTGFYDHTTNCLSKLFGI